MRTRLLSCFLLLYFSFLTYLSARQQPGNVTCAKDLFKCEHSGRCIPMTWRCDVEMDCAFGEDEKDCDVPNKPLCNAATEYQCSEFLNNEGDPARHSHDIYGTLSLFKHRCIPKEWVCDGEADCINKDDELHCDDAIKCNSETKFQCKTLSKEFQHPVCIPLAWVCDGQSDCMDMSDEANCTAKLERCDTNEFQCASGGCIYATWKCDGESDCVDGSDERDCPIHECEKPDFFRCTNGEKCYPAKRVCDGVRDCSDNSDESQCEKPTSYCTNKEFKCKDGTQCVSSLWRCDGDADCTDGSDELDCTVFRCGPNDEMCADGRSCYGQEAYCDGVKDCADGSDERNCPLFVGRIETRNSSAATIAGTRTMAPVCDPILDYVCPETPARCVKLDRLCVTPNADCATSVCNRNITMCDESDSECKCRKMGHRGKLCQCRSGLRFNGARCEDINECENHGICDQICINNFGSYSCDCYPGYLLTIGSSASFNDDGGGHMPHRCRAVGPDPKLLLSNRATIRQYDLVTNKYHPLISSLESAVALDYWNKNNTLIWSDVSKKQIMICHIGNQTLLHNIGDCLDHGNVTLISDDVQTPDGLAIDWVHGLLFWTDTGLNMISVFDLHTKRRKVIIDKNLDEPRAIAVDPSAGLIFWTDWGKNASIERAGMDGRNRMVIVSGDSVRWPNGLALDILDRRVYWADAKLKTISSCDYWGKNIRTVLHSHRYLRHPFSLAVFEEKLYWTDWDHEGVISVNKFRGDDAKMLVSGMTGPMTVRVYHKQAQPDHPDKCVNHLCDHLCLPRAHMLKSSESRELETLGTPYTCACDRGFEPSVDDATMCIPLSAAIDLLSKQASASRLSYFYFALLFVVAAALIMMYVQHRQRPNHFAVLHFDNPIYRRTVEDLDADVENPPDNSLGAISALPVVNEPFVTNTRTTKASADGSVIS